MGFFSNWQMAKMAKYEEKNLCPDCKGRGIHYFAGSEFYFGEPIQCSGCNGTGLYTEWANNN